MPPLTPAEFRSLSTATVLIEDDALQILLDGAEAAITELCGPWGTATEIRDGGTTYLTLGRRISDVVRITERWSDETLVLDPDDYEVRGSYAIRRLNTGTNPSVGWVGSVLVEYEPADDDALRRLAQAELVKLEIISNPGLAMLIVGNWTIQLAQGKSYADLRESILSTLPAAGPAWA